MASVKEETVNVKFVDQVTESVPFLATRSDDKRIRADDANRRTGIRGSPALVWVDSPSMKASAACSGERRTTGGIGLRVIKNT